MLRLSTTYCISQSARRHRYQTPPKEACPMTAMLGRAYDRTSVDIQDLSYREAISVLLPFFNSPGNLLNKVASPAVWSLGLH